MTAGYAFESNDHGAENQYKKIETNESSLNLSNYNFNQDSNRPLMALFHSKNSKGKTVCFFLWN